MLPQALKYTKDNIWVYIKGDRAKIGITEYFLGDSDEVVNIALPKKGEDIDKDEVFGGIDTEDKMLDLIAPLSGEVVRINNSILEDNQIVTEDPYGEGWLIEIEMYDPEELEELLEAEEYENIVG